jgi:hypothetical protein
MTPIRRLGIVLLLPLSLTGLSGCVAAAVGTAAGAGAAVYVTGALKGEMEASLDKTYEASQEAVKELEFTESQKAKDAIQAFVEARMADDTKVKISLRKKTGSLTEVTIRVGTFGDKEKSILIWDSIRKNL